MTTVTTPATKISKTKIFGIFTGLTLLGTVVGLWTSDHGFIATVLAIFCGILWLGAWGFADPGTHTSAKWAGVAINIGILLVSVNLYNHYDARAIKEAQEAKDKEVAKQEAIAKEAAMTPEERKQKDFENERSTKGYVLTAVIKQTAFDPDALKLQRPEYYSDGVCVLANGKNRFGAYVGWQKHCYTYKQGAWTYHGPN